MFEKRIYAMMNNHKGRHWRPFLWVRTKDKHDKLTPAQANLTQQPISYNNNVKVFKMSSVSKSIQTVSYYNVDIFEHNNYTPSITKENEDVRNKRARRAEVFIRVTRV